MEKGKIKIFQLVDSLSLGGAERMSVNIANALVDQGYVSHLLVTRKSGGLISHINNRVVVKNFHKKSALDFIAFYYLLSYLIKEKPNVLHAHQTSIYWGVVLKLFLPNTKLIWHDHFGKIDQLEFLRKKIQWIAGSIDFIITVNDRISEFWEARLPNLKSRIKYLKNFPELREVEYKPDPNKFKIINLANLRKQKDQLTLLDAFAIFKLDKPKAQLFLVGEFIERDWVSLVEAKISALGLNEDVKLMGPVENVLPLLATASLGVLSSESEGLPVSLLEYGMVGLPAVSTSVGQCEEVLGYGEFGYLVPAKSPEKLANAFEAIYYNKEEASNLGLRFKSHVKKHYGPSNFLDLYSKILTQLQIIKS